jgi:hypothetical protein
MLMSRATPPYLCLLPASAAAIQMAMAPEIKIPQSGQALCVFTLPDRT